MWKVFCAFFIIALAAGCAKPTPVPYPTAIPPTAIPTVVPSPTATATPTLVPGKVTLLTGGNCPVQTVYDGQAMEIVHDFKLGNKSMSTWLTKKSLVTVTIDGNNWYLSARELWSPVVISKGSDGTYYQTTFRWDLPKMSVGTHRIRIEFSVPIVMKSYAYASCTILTVLSR